MGYALPELHSPDGRLHQTDEEYPPKVHQDLLETVLEVMSSVKGIDPSRGRTTPRDRSTRAVTDRIGEKTGDSRVKRRSTDTSVASEPIAMIEELRAQCQSLRNQLNHMEAYAASRDQLIHDIEIRFTEYLQEHNQNVFDEVNALNHRLSCSANEVAEYQAELMVASQEDEGATIRIQDLERRGALMEHGARRIHQRGMEIQEEYKDDITFKDYWVIRRQDCNNFIKPMS